MKQIISMLSVGLLVVTMLTACNAPSDSESAYDALVFGYSDAAEFVDCEIEYKFEDYEKYQSLEPDDQIEINLGDGIYTASNPSKVYTQNNYYPEFQYESGDNITFTVDDQGRLTYAFWSGHTMDYLQFCSQEECLQIATAFMEKIINTSEYSISISDEDTEYYTVKFVKHIGDFQTNDSASVKVYKDGTIYSYSSSMLGRIPADIVTSDIDLKKVKEAATSKLDQIFAKAKDVYDRMEYGEPIIRLTVLKDGSRALIYTVVADCRTDIGNGLYASVGERISMVVTIP